MSADLFKEKPLPLFPAQTLELQPATPVENQSHEDSAFGVVYVNDLARPMLAQPTPAFPVGSVIIREKLLQADATAPQFVIAMIKREKGFNPAGGDWEFAAFDGALKKVEKREKTGSCLACHAQKKDNDFVFRSYLPEIKN